MGRFVVEQPLQVHQDEAWKTLSDFGNIATWNTGIDASRIIAGPDQGVGAERQCDFGKNHLREKIVDWREGQGFTIDFTHFPAPMTAQADLDLHPAGGGSRFVVQYRFQGKGLMRPFGFLLKPVLRKAIRGLARDFQAAVES